MKTKSKKKLRLKMLVEVDRAIKKVADLEKLYAKMVQKK